MSNIFIPNSFQVPNALIDEVVADLSGAELKCYLFIVRKTVGWNKESDAISISQFMSALKLSNKTVVDACKRLAELGLVLQKTGVRNTNIFSLNLCKNFTSEENSHVQKVQATSVKTSQDPVKKLHTQSNTIKNNITNTNLTVSNARTKKTSEFDLLEQFGIEGDLATDFVKHRKACKAPITKTALTGFKREAEKAGISIQQAVTIAIERGWRGFNASWQWRDEQSFAKNTQSKNQNATQLRMNDPGCMAGQIVNIEGEIWEL